MKLLVALIRPERLGAVREALASAEVKIMTITNVKGCGVQGGRTEIYRGQEVEVDLLPKVKLEIALNEDFVDPAIDAIVQSARTENSGAIGDGKIFVLPLENCIRIRTGEEGQNAIGP